MVKCPRGCNAFLEFDTDTIGRTVERCPRCGATAVGSRITSETPPAPQLLPPPPAQPPTEATMAKIILKKCQRSGREYKATGNSQKFCKECPACKAAADVPLKKSPEKPRTPAKTAFPPRSTRSASGIDLSGAIGEIEKQVAALDAQRERLLGAIESLRELEAA